MWSGLTDTESESTAEAADVSGPDLEPAGGPPAFIDQPWVRSTIPGTSVSFEFPGSNSTDQRPGSDGLGATSAIRAGSDDSNRAGGSIECNATEASKAAPAFDANSASGQIRLTDVAMSNGAGQRTFAEPVTTAVGNGTRFGGTDAQGSAAVRGVVVGSGATAIWCVVTLPAAQVSLADLTLQRIISTLGPA